LAGNPLHAFRAREGGRVVNVRWRVVVGREPLLVAFQASEGVVVGASALRHSDCEWAGDA